jgi:hypothetical protein
VKVPELMLKYLLQTKALHIQGLGSFKLSHVDISPDDIKGAVIPEGALSFTLDYKTKEDQALVAFISAETGKIKPLAASDLESVIIQGKQLLNISKPFTIDGLGTLQKNMRNEIDFIPYVASDKKDGARKDKRKDDTQDSIHYDDNYLKPLRNKGNGSRNLTLATLIFLGLGIIGWVGYYFYQKSSFEEVQLSAISLSSPPAEDTVSRQPEVTPSLQPADTLNKSISLPPAEISDVQFNVVVEVAKKNRAFKRYADLKEWGHKVIMYTADSIEYKIAFPVKAPLSDTIRYRDSLSRFFGRKVWIENK